MSPKKCLILFVFLISWFVLSLRPASADCELGACFGIGAELASIDSNDGPILNLLTQLLLDSSVAINVGNWEGVAQTDVNLFGLLNAVRIQAGAASTEQALTASITLLDLIDAAVTALENEGDLVGVAVIEDLHADLLAIPDMNNTIQLGSLIQLADTQEALLDIDLNVLQLILGSLQVFNSENTLDTPDPISVSTAPILNGLGLGAIASEVTLSLRVTEPPQFRCGPTGTTVQSANVRLKLDIDLLNDFNLSTNLGLASVDLTLTQLSLYLELAPSQATSTGLSLANAESGTLTFDVTYGLARIYLGLFDDAEFFNPAYSIPSGATVLNDLDPSIIGDVDLTLLGTGSASAAVSMRSYAEGTQSTSGLVFTTFPDSQTVDSSVGVIGSLVSDLVANLELSIDASGLLFILSALGAVVDDLIDVIEMPLGLLLDGQLLSPILTSTVDSLLSSLGVSIGKATVFVAGFSGVCTVEGRVYEDNNLENELPDTDENWNQGVPVWIHAIKNGELSKSVKVIAGNGQFSLSGLPLGDYIFIISNEAGATTVSVPEDWILVSPNDGQNALQLISVAVVDIFFGLRREQLQVNGRVFLDTGIVSGTANDGIQNGGEMGEPSATVKLLETVSGTVITTASSDENGDYQLRLPNSWLNESLSLQLQSPEGEITISISEGDSGGAYNSNTESLNFTPISASLSDINIAIVPPSSFHADVEVISGAGKTVFMSHRFLAGSAGTLNLSAAPATTQTIGWNSVVYQDGNCDGNWDAGETAVTAAVILEAGELFCILHKVVIASSAKEGATVHWNLEASYLLNGSITEQLYNYDLVKVSDRYAGALLLTKEVDKSTALPGESLQYTIHYENTGETSLSNLTIYDQTPAFTLFDTTECTTNIGTGLVTCIPIVPAQGETGSLNWGFSGELAASASGSLSFTIVIQEN